MTEWAYVPPGPQTSAEGEFDLLLLDLFPDTVAPAPTPPVATKPKNKRSEIEVLDQVERSEYVDREIRMTLVDKHKNMSKNYLSGTESSRLCGALGIVFNRSKLSGEV